MPGRLILSGTVAFQEVLKKVFALSVLQFVFFETMDFLAQDRALEDQQDQQQSAGACQRQGQRRSLFLLFL